MNIFVCGTRNTFSSQTAAVAIELHYSIDTLHSLFKTYDSNDGM